MRQEAECCAISKKKLENEPGKQQKNTGRQETKEEKNTVKRSSRQELPCTGREKDDNYTEQLDPREGKLEI